jgi:hypothetical protein
MLQRMLASKDEATTSPQDNLNSSQVKLPWTQAPGSAYAAGSSSSSGDSVSQQQGPAEATVTDESQTQAGQPAANKGSVSEVTKTPDSPGRIVEQGQQPTTEPDLYRNWYNLREKDPEAALNLAQNYLQTFPESSDPQQVRRARAVRDYLNRAAQQPRVNINLYGYSAEQPPTDSEISDRIAAQLGFTQAEAEAYRSEMGHDPFYWSSGLQANKALAARATAHPLGAVSIPETRTGAIAETQVWLRNHREQARLQELAALPDLQAKYFAARRIAAVRPLTEEEKRILEVDKMDGSMLGGLPVSMAGGLVRGVGSLLAGLGQLFSGLSDDESRRLAELTNKVVNWTPLTDAEEAEYQQLTQRANSVQRYGIEAQKKAQAGLNVFEPHTLPGALAEAGGEILPEIGLSLGLPELRLAHAAYWAGVSYLKARGSGASKAQAIGDAATAVAMLGASAPLSPLAAEAGEGWRNALAKGVTRGAIGVGMGSALGAVQPGATPQSALSQGLQFGLMNLAGGGRGESEERMSVTPREPELRGQELPALEQNRAAGEIPQRVYDRYPTGDIAPRDSGQLAQPRPASEPAEETPIDGNMSRGRDAAAQPPAAESVPDASQAELLPGEQGRPTQGAVASDAVPTESRGSDADVVTQPDAGTTGSSGRATSKNYRATFFRAYPEYKGKVVVHHAIEQQVLDKYPGLFTEAEIHALENLRGIPVELHPLVHLRQIRRVWNQFYRSNATATRQQVIEVAQRIDDMFGEQLKPKRTRRGD